MGKLYHLDWRETAVLTSHLASLARAAACTHCAAPLATATITFNKARLTYGFYGVTTTCPECGTERVLDIEITRELVSEAQRVVGERRQQPISADEVIELHALLERWPDARPLSELAT